MLARVQSRGPDLSWVLPELAVGGRCEPWHATHLARELLIARVVDLRAEERDDERSLAEAGIAWLHLPTPDLAPPTDADLRRGVAWVREAIDRGERVLVHCEHGIGRSAVLVCCVMVSLGWEARDALAHAKRRRAKVSPSPEQLAAYVAFARGWHAEWGGPRPPAGWEELAPIAYAHLGAAPAGR
jgi:predicted protein tyrosine phosphatase